MTTAPTTPETLRHAARCLDETGFAFVPAHALRAALGEAALREWPAFAASWDDLRLDTYMADGGRYRQRRHAVLSAGADGEAIALEPHQPHYQALEYNRLNGGIARHFEPVERRVIEGATLQAVLALGLQLFRRLYPARAAHIEVHQFRIEARADVQGRPTPEGAHRDGVDFVLVMMVRRVNIASGTTEIFDLAQRRIDAFTLVEPGDAALVDDQRALHGVTPITPVDASRPAWRDVLVATYRSRPA